MGAFHAPTLRQTWRHRVPGNPRRNLSWPCRTLQKRHRATIGRVRRKDLGILRGPSNNSTTRCTPPSTKSQIGLTQVGCGGTNSNFPPCLFACTLPFGVLTLSPSFSSLLPACREQIN